MARVLFSVAMDAERRAVLASKATAGLEAVILADLPPSERDAAWASAEVLVCTGFGWNCRGTWRRGRPVSG